MTALQISQTRLDGVLLIKPPTIFQDRRGSYIETYNEELYKEAGITCVFVQDDISTSHRNVLRGIHGDQQTWKLISCLYGEFYLVVLNYNPSSPQFGQWVSYTLAASDSLQVLIPPRFGNGHVVLSETAIFHYKQSAYYNPAEQFTVLWNDPRFKIRWPIEKPVLSPRDEGSESA